MCFTDNLTLFIPMELNRLKCVFSLLTAEVTDMSNDRSIKLVFLCFFFFFYPQRHSLSLSTYSSPLGGQSLD